MRGHKGSSVRTRFIALTGTNSKFDPSDNYIHTNGTGMHTEVDFPLGPVGKRASGPRTGLQGLMQHEILASVRLFHYDLRINSGYLQPHSNQ